MAFAADKIRQATAGTGGFEIDQSLRTDRASSTTLTKTFASAGNRKTWSFSVWFKRGNMGGVNNSANKHTFFNGYDDDNMVRIADDCLQIYAYASSVDYGWISEAVVRDPSAWYHALFVTDTTNGTAAQRQRIYLNGVELTTRGTDYGNPPEDYDGQINTASAHLVAGSHSSTGFDGHLAEVHFIDGTALTPTSFGETGDYGEWKPIEVEGLTYGTNGFYLSFAGGGIMSATGGNSTATDGDYKAASFTADGTFTPSADGYVEYLVIAGGGGGGFSDAGVGGGGAGAGGYRTGMLPVTASTAYSITVGAGGTGGGSSTSSANGTNSVFSSITSIGGGRGGHGGATGGSDDGGNGGSGGAGAYVGGGAKGDSGTGTSGQGYAGATSVTTDGTSAGGGAGAVGGTGSSSNGGNGGAGLSSSITGSSVCRAGGGAGGGRPGNGVGHGSATCGGSTNGANATANTGGGGGGATYEVAASGNGGSGVVILRYKFQ